MDNSLTWLFWLVVWYTPSLTYALFTREKPTPLQDKRVDIFMMNTFCPPWAVAFILQEWL